MKKRILAGICLVIIIVFAVGLYAKQNNKSADEPSGASATTQSSTKNAPGFNTEQYSLTKSDSLWVVVNKQNPLPKNYVPADLTVPNVRLRLSSTQQQMQFSKRAETDLKKMFAEAKQNGANLVFGSGYRSATLQQQFYSSYVAADGQAAADRYSARPGYSEHQTGLGVDITSPSGTCHLQICWENTVEGKWLAANSYKYGFIIRYPKSKESITGYQYEPWHIRYVGTDLAAEMKQKNIQTMEEFFKLPPAPTY